MNKLNILEELELRGFISKISNILDLKNEIINSSISLYCGFDPTAESLHIGHLLPLLCLQWFQKYGHRVIIVVGYATSLIGDPSFKLQERKLEVPNNMLTWCEKITNQINQLFQQNNCDIPIILNNYDWFKKINVISFLRDIGKFFSVNQMINRKCVKNRINRLEQGISFTEFSYNLLQSYDFLRLYERYNVTLQIGGSDQWGNISSGISLINRLYKKQVFGLTIPLLTQSNGVKFGKTENNNMVWLDKNRTSPYTFYQFWLNIHDDNIINFLKLFTFLNLSDIQTKQLLYSSKLEMKKILADHITLIVHGDSSLKSAQRITYSLFHNQIINLTYSDIDQLKQDGMFYKQYNQVVDLKQSLIDANFSSSRSESHRLILSNAIKINGRLENNSKYQFNENDKLFDKFTILSKGKKKYFLLCW